MNRKNIVLTVVAVLLALVLAAGIGGLLWYRNTHVEVDGVAFEADLEYLDLRGQNISPERYQDLRAALPQCTIRWDVPFQGLHFPDDTQELTVTELSPEDITALGYFPRLTRVDATACRDYPAILELMERYPDCQVDYVVEVGGMTCDRTVEALEFTGNQVEAAALTEALTYLPGVAAVHFTDPALTGQELRTLREAFPDVQFTWSRESFGIDVTDATTELDLSGRVVDLDRLREEAAYLPSLEKVLLIGCGYDDETMAAYREEVRGEFKPVWEVKVGPCMVRTDATYFMPGKDSKRVNGTQMANLRYCEDMLCVDVGHMMVLDCSWVEGMPHLKYLILADTHIADISPLGCLKELVYLELFMTNVRDVSTLVGCTALEDVSMAVSPVDPKPFAQMPWLKNLWVNRCHVTKEDRQLLTESLPNTHIEFDHGWPTGGGWRELQNYFDMRDLLGMPYNAW